MGSLILIPVLSTLACWLVTYLTMGMFFFPSTPKKMFGLTFQGIIPARTRELTAQLFDMLSKQFVEDPKVKQKLINNTSFEFLMPEIEAHIDDFLRHRLGKKMPMIGMFIGENTIRQLKDIFMEELKEILPSVMQTYVDGLSRQDDFRKFLGEWLSKSDVSLWKSALYPIISKDLRFVSLIGGVVGFLIGIVQVLIVVFVYGL